MHPRKRIDGLLKLFSTGLFVMGLTACVPAHLIAVDGTGGIVLDKVSHAPIPGAKVYCHGHEDRSVDTSSDGKFVIPDIREWQMAMLAEDNFPLPCYVVVEAAGYIKGEFGGYPPSNVFYLSPRT